MSERKTTPPTTLTTTTTTTISETTFSCWTWCFFRTQHQRIICHQWYKCMESKANENETRNFLLSKLETQPNIFIRERLRILIVPNYLWTFFIEQKSDQFAPKNNTKSCVPTDELIATNYIRTYGEAVSRNIQTMWFGSVTPSIRNAPEFYFEFPKWCSFHIERTLTINCCAISIMCIWVYLLSVLNPKSKDQCYYRKDLLSFYATWKKTGSIPFL